MRLIFSTLCFPLLLASARRRAPSEPPASNGRNYGAVVPLPRIIHPRNPPHLISLSPDTFRFYPSLKGCDILNAALARYPKLIFARTPAYPVSVPREYKSAGNVESLTVTVKSAACPHYPSLHSNENYTLDVYANGSSMLVSDTVWGSLRGLETFSQLVFSPSRGAELMGQNKLNVFHWHVVDDPSFPFRSLLFPKLAEEGAYSAAHVYTPQDVSRVVEEARLRGIRVIPEFDTPGHTGSWAAAKDLLTRCYDEAGIPTDTYKALDPSKSTTWDFLYTFFSEILRLFPDGSLHLGGDEVKAYKDCWMSNPQTINLMKALNISTWQQLEGYYFKNFAKLLKRIRPKGLQMIAWNEVFDHGDPLPVDETVIQVWTEPWSVKLDQITKKGYGAILSSCWYLDIINRTPRLEALYTCDPHNFSGSPEQQKLVLGGEACLWGEFVDGTNLTPRLWPRASVVAERLWSSAEEQNLHQAGLRFDEHRCRLISRGYPAEPLLGPGYCTPEWDQPAEGA